MDHRDTAEELLRFEPSSATAAVAHAILALCDQLADLPAVIVVGIPEDAE